MDEPLRRAPTPVVLITIDKYSVLHIRQTDSVLVGFIDDRVDPYGVILLPSLNQSGEILDICQSKYVISEGHDDPAKTAASIIRRIRSGLLVVAGGPDGKTR